MPAFLPGRLFLLTTMFTLAMMVVLFSGRSLAQTTEGKPLLLRPYAATTSSDSYEPDDTCEQASSITTDGVSQSHTFQQANDVDWLSFDAIAGQTYIIEASATLSSTASPTLSLYPTCLPDGPFGMAAALHNPAAGMAQIEVIIPVSGRYYFKVSHSNSDNFTGIPAYTVFVRRQPSESGAALIVVAGRLSDGDGLQSNIHHVTTALYNRFRSYGYHDEQIYYLATDATLAGYDDAATRDNLRYAITTWAANKISRDHYLTVYLVGHSAADLFYLDEVNAQQLTSADLDAWLTTLESAIPGLKVNLILDQAYAGSFITAPASVSKAGRLLLTSTDTSGLAFTSANGAIFSDAFINALTPGHSINDVFQIARTTTISQTIFQKPQVDGDGDGIPDEAEDVSEAQRRILFTGSDPATPTPTPVAPTPVAPTPTAPVTPEITLTPTPVTTPTGAADVYEPDDNCNQAQPIASDGISQGHTFGQLGDLDWVKVSVSKETTYQIEVTAPPVSPADLQLEIYASCASVPTTYETVGPGVTARLRAPATGDYYLKLVNRDPNTFGAHVTYDVAVRRLPLGPQAGAVVIVAGSLYSNDELQPNIHAATNAFYQLFRSRGYSADRIYYLANDQTLDPDHNPNTQDVDAPATRANLEYAITQWATTVDGLGAERALTLYMMDHGNKDLFYLNHGRETVSPQEIDGWLAQVEQRAPGVAVNIVIDACFAGTFIDADNTLSKPGRVIITSTSNQSVAYVGNEPGAVFSNPFIQALAQDLSLFQAFTNARNAALAFQPDQVAWLDDNGNGIPNEAGVDGRLAQQRGFAFAGTLQAWGQTAPYLARLDPPQLLVDGQGLIQAQVRSDRPIDQVWAVIFEPAYRPPTPTGALLSFRNQPVVRLTDPEGDGSYRGIYANFTQAGVYRIVVYAIDQAGLQSQPTDVHLLISRFLYLPMVMRK